MIDGSDSITTIIHSSSPSLLPVSAMVDELKRVNHPVSSMNIGKRWAKKPICWICRVDGTYPGCLVRSRYLESVIVDAAECGHSKRLEINWFMYFYYHHISSVKLLSRMSESGLTSPCSYDGKSETQSYGKLAGIAMHACAAPYSNTHAVSYLLICHSCC